MNSGRLFHEPFGETYRSAQKMIGYFDLPSGISGDMCLGCLLDVGWSIDRLRNVISKLGLPDGQWSVESRQVRKGTLRATMAEVCVSDCAKKGPCCRHDHDGENGKQPNGRKNDGPHPVHRNLPDVLELINSADLPDPIKEKSSAVFERLARAEAKVHGVRIEEIHFHEVGSLDAIIDIVGTVTGIYEIGIKKLYASELPLGRGWVTAQHGKIPLPSPATMELLAEAKAPTRCAPGDGELVTPTGAALICELAEFGQKNMIIEKIGVGAGQKDFPWPNVARLWLGRKKEFYPKQSEKVLF